jgi:signal transduction histidine kinase
MTHLARQRGVSVAANIADDLPPVRTDADAVREIFFNLLANAIEACGSPVHGRVPSLLEVTARATDGQVVTTVRDDGPGIAESVRARLFEPFVTTKAEGTGLGLYVVGRRVREAGGEISCESAQGAGTTFTVKLPAALGAGG